MDILQAFEGEHRGRTELITNLCPYNMILSLIFLTKVWTYRLFMVCSKFDFVSSLRMSINIFSNFFEQ